MDVVVQNDPFFENIYWFNEMTRTPEVRTGVGWRTLKDSDFTDAHIYVQEFYLRTIGYKIVEEIVLRDCERRKRHPVRDYLNSLVWDGEIRLNDWLVNYLGCDATPYVCKIGRLYLTAAVARIFEPGCKCDYVLVLEGEQGLEKSKVWKTLFKEYHTDSIPDITSKDASIHVSRFWCVEISEMAAYNKHDDAYMKSFITRTVEQYRPVHGRMGVDVPRQCVIAGSVNDATYLKDETGNRRWWPVKCSKIDIERLEEDRDQLFAEAVHLYKTKQPWWPDRAFEKEYIAPEQATRLVVDEMFNIVGEHVNNPAAYVTETRIKTLWILLFPQGDPTIPQLQQRRLASALRLHGFEQVRDSKGIKWRRGPR
jgi:predicted P-loop ATPase